MNIFFSKFIQNWIKFCQLRVKVRTTLYDSIDMHLRITEKLIIIDKLAYKINEVFILMRLYGSFFFRQMEAKQP